jgi:hypothetical protein
MRIRAWSSGACPRPIFEPDKARQVILWSRSTRDIDVTCRPSPSPSSTSATARGAPSRHKAAEPQPKKEEAANDLP